MDGLKNIDWKDEFDKLKSFDKYILVAYIKWINIKYNTNIPIPKIRVK